MSASGEGTRTAPCPVRSSRPADLAAALGNMILPPVCLACGEIIGASGGLCTACWQGIAFLGPPHCACCGFPFDFPMETDALCGACVEGAYPFARARAVFVYDEASRGMVISFKHADRTDGAPAYGRWLARAGAELIHDADLVVPVPLHWTRLFRRRYNQAALLAREVAAISGRPLDLGLLKRRRRTQSLGHLSPDQRRRVVGGAFAVKSGRSVAGRRILLIDDVFTTGATAAACVRALRGAGAEAVDLLTLARVVRPAY